MMKMATQGDIGAVFRFTVVDNKGSAVNLTGGTAILMTFPTTPVNGGGVNTYTMVLSDPLNGVVTYTTTGNEFPVGNIKYQLQVKVTIGVNTYSSDVVEVFVRPTLSTVNYPYLGY